MDKGQTVGTVLMALCCFGCGVLFLGIGIWAGKSQKPVNFWAGTKLNSGQVMDVKRYNQENALMWTVYSIPYILAAVLSVFQFVCRGFTVAAVVVLALACFPGILLLVRHYRKIERKYIVLGNT